MQIGIDSFGPKDCENPEGKPDVFTSVSGNLDWIRGVIDGSIPVNSYGEESNEETTANHHGHTSPKPSRKPVNRGG